MRKYLLDFVLIMIITAMFNALLVQVISPTATLMLSPLVMLFAEILRKQAAVACTCFGVGSVWIYKHFADTSTIPIAAVLVGLALKLIANRHE